MESNQDRHQSIKITKFLKDSITENMQFIKENIYVIKYLHKRIDEHLKESFDCLEKFIKVVDNSLVELNKQTYIKNIFFKDVLRALENFHYNNNKIFEISKEMEEIIKKIYEKSKSLNEMCFNPPNINDKSNISINIPENSEQGIIGLNDVENKTKSFIKESSLYQVKSYKSGTFEKERAESREKFLDSISILIKRILWQCNYIITNEFEEEKYSNIKEVYKNFNYPNIKEPFSNETYLNFIKNIDDILRKNFDIDNFTNTNLILFDLEEDLMNKMEEIFHFKEKYVFKSNYLSFDNEDNSLFFSQENYLEKTFIKKNDNDIKYIKAEGFYDYINLIYRKKKRQKNNNEYSFLRGDNKKKEEINNKINKKKLSLNKNEFTYMIDCISNKNTKRDKNLEDEIINAIKYKLESHYVITLKDFLIDFLITTERFTKLSLLEIICNFPKYKELIELYEFKIIKDTICKECEIEDYIDNRGNIILTGREYKIVGKDKYCFIPSGWVAIGIKDDGNNEEWTRGFCPLGENLESKEIKEKLKNIIINGFEKEELQKNKSSISSKILSNRFGIIILNNLKFGIMLMIKINNELLKKRKQKGIELNNHDIKPIAILLKKIDN